VICSIEISLLIILLLYVSSLSSVIVGWIQIKKKPLISEVTHQNISIVIAVRNEGDRIKACLTSVINQNYDKSNFELILIDDHSTDGTIQIAEKAIENTSLNFTIVKLKDKYSKKEALKKGVKYAQHPIIALTDGDCILPPNWLSIISNHLKNEVSMLLGPVIFSDGQGFLGTFQFLDMCAVQGVTFGLAYYHQPVLNNGANLAYLKETYHQVNGYDNYNTPSGDDIFLLEKFKSHRKKVVGIMDEQFIVKTYSERSWSSFINQRLRWASKTGYYKDVFLIFVSSIIFIQNLIVFFIYLGMLFVEEIRFIGIILIISKWLIDFILLFLLSSYFKQRDRLLYFIPVQLVYPIYIVTVAVASKFYKFKWKDRIFNE